MNRTRLERKLHMCRLDDTLNNEICEAETKVRSLEIERFGSVVSGPTRTKVTAFDASDPASYFSQWLPEFGEAVARMETAWACSFHSDHVIEIGLIGKNLVTSVALSHLFGEVREKAPEFFSELTSADHRHAAVETLAKDLLLRLDCDAPLSFSIETKAELNCIDFDLCSLKNGLRSLIRVARSENVLAKVEGELRQARNEFEQQVAALEHKLGPPEPRPRGRPTVKDEWVPFVRDVMHMYVVITGSKPTITHSKFAENQYTGPLFDGLAHLYTALPVHCRTKTLEQLGSRIDEQLNPRKRNSGKNKRSKLGKTTR